MSAFAHGRDVMHMPFLTDVMYSITLVEYGKQQLFRQSRENVRSEIHQDLLDEVHLRFWWLLI